MSIAKFATVALVASTLLAAPSLAADTEKCVAGSTKAGKPAEHGAPGGHEASTGGSSASTPASGHSSGVQDPDTTRANNAWRMRLDWSPFGFLTDDVSYGTPAQKFKTFVDWTWISQYLASTRCTPEAKGCVDKAGKVFDEHKSTSFSNASREEYPSRTWNPNHFFFTLDLNVDHAWEVVHQGGISSELMVQVTNFNWVIPTEYPFAGVFGLSPRLPYDNLSNTSPFYQAYQQGYYESPVFSFIYCYEDKMKDACDGHDAVQEMGTYSKKHIDAAKMKESGGDLEWYDIFWDFKPVNIDFAYSPAFYEYWTADWVGLWLDDEAQDFDDHGAGAVFDHASYGRGAPLSNLAYKSLVKKTNAKPIKKGTFSQDVNNGNNTDGYFSVDCDKIDTFPVLKYQFGDKKSHIWETTPKHYVQKVNGTCVLDIRVAAGGDDDGDVRIGNFGETFLKDKFAVFDFGARRVGLAELKL